MATELQVSIADRPGAAAEAAEPLAREGINVEGVACLPAAGQALLHLVVEDATAAREALTAGGQDVVGEREVVLVEVDDRPGALVEACAAVAEAGVNLTGLYLATATRLVLVADDPAALRQAL